MTGEDLRFYAQVIGLGVLMLLVDLLGLIMIAWQHQGEALAGMTAAIFLTLGSTVVLAYRLGRAR